MNYYNENNPSAAAWLRELIRAGHIASGIVDERSITDVKANELGQYNQCHFFAGIGGWSLALRLAGWPDERPVWTGSCPCQPFSGAGKNDGLLDERHLWPAFRGLISERDPAIVFGEQVASKSGREWLAGVRSDLEGMGYAVGGADLCAAGVGAPHIRQRLYWVADSTGGGQRTDGSAPRPPGHPEQREQTERLDHSISNGRRKVWDNHGEHDGNKPYSKREDGRLGHPDSSGCEEQRRAEPAQGPSKQQPTERRGDDGTVADTKRDGGRADEPKRTAEGRAIDGRTSFWSDSIWLKCTDGKQRRISSESALFPLAPRIPGRVGMLRGAGNAIVPQLAAQFIQACDEIINK